jgi:bleomycin hydrolase
MKLLILAFLFAFTISAYSQPSSNGKPRIRLTDSVQCSTVKNQHMSPTCWVFGTNSLFESDLMRKYGIQTNLSEMFIARYAYIDKARKWLETGGKTYYEGGGQFHDVIRVINRYGMMPESAYDGLPGNLTLHDHSRLDTAIRHLSRDWLRAGKKQMNDDDLRQINDSLDKYLGRIPEDFIYQGKTYTPKTFAAAIARFGDDYVELMSFSNMPLNKKCFLDDKFNWAGDSLFNISLEDLQASVDTALAKGWSVGWEGDVTEPGFRHFAGLATIEDPAHKFDEERLVNYENLSTERDHMLHIVGVGKDEAGNKWYYLKNSWGTNAGPYGGYLYMNETYFKLKTVILMVNKEALREPFRKKLGL